MESDKRETYLNPLISALKMDQKYDVFFGRQQGYGNDMNLVKVDLLCIRTDAYKEKMFDSSTEGVDAMRSICKDLEFCVERDMNILLYDTPNEIVERRLIYLEAEALLAGDKSIQEFKKLSNDFGIPKFEVFTNEQLVTLMRMYRYSRTAPTRNPFRANKER